LKSTFSYQKNETIYRQGKAATYVYQVVNGATRILRTLSNGRRQIGAFYFPGDIFGLEPWIQYRWSAEAIVGTTTVHRVERKAVHRKARSASSLTWSVLSIVERDLLHADDHRIMLGTLTATERIAAFLLQMNNRIGVSGGIELPMSRADVADYLGLTVETAAREITKLSDQRILKRSGGPGPYARRLTLLRPASLRAMLPPLSALDLSPIREDVIQAIFFQDLTG
jgi:CRP/FNR family nitrogen fixation transcriptional regulator